MGTKMSKYVKVNKGELLYLLEWAASARSLLDAVHCYDTPQYDNLGEALDKITYEDID